MKLFLKLSVITLLFVVVSCSKKGITLPNLENTTWRGNISDGEVFDLVFNFQKNGILKITSPLFTPKDTTGTWQVKEFAFSAQFVRRDNDTILFKAPVSNTTLEGTISLNGNLAATFSVQKQ